MHNSAYLSCIGWSEIKTMGMKHQGKLWKQIPQQAALYYI
jgi:hypothetical protein